MTAENGEFHYPLPEDDGSRGWGDLSDTAREAFSGKVLGSNEADGLPFEKSETELNQEIRAWAMTELAEASLKWQPYREHIPELPYANTEILDTAEKRPELFAKLFNAKEALLQSGHTDPEGVNIGETMHLVLVPWASFYNQLNHLSFQNMEQWLRGLRRAQGIAQRYDDIATPLQTALLNDGQLYRGEGDPTVRWGARAYLDRKRTKDDSFGIMLAQTSNKSGIDIPASEPDPLTKNGTEHFAIGNVDVDAMGIFEWLSLSLQEDMSSDSGESDSWLLANRMVFPGSPNTPDTPSVPVARWRDPDSRFVVLLQSPEKAAAGVKIKAKPRLAVL